LPASFSKYTRVSSIAARSLRSSEIILTRSIGECRGWGKP
jgi:hypothetical protein